MLRDGSALRDESMTLRHIFFNVLRTFATRASRGAARAIALLALLLSLAPAAWADGLEIRSA
jgi:hypothetical protein